MEKHHNAGYPYLLIPTSEEDRIIRENRKKIPVDVQFFRWDITTGMRTFVNPNGDPDVFIWKTVDEDVLSPTDALDMVVTLPENSIIFMHDFHEFFTAIGVQRAALNLKDHLKSNSKMVVFLMPGPELPLAVRDSVKILDFPMPDEAELQALLAKFCDDYEMTLPENAVRVVDAMKGLTLEGAENALALSLSQKGIFDYKVVLEAKAAMLKSTEYLSMMFYRETFDDLYGYDALKEYAPGCIASGEGKGILIYGVPGTGKSHFSKALANEMQLPCLNLNMAALRGGVVGETETKTRDAFARIQAFGKSVVFVDEMEKSFAGMESSGKTDSGVSTRLGQSFLSYWEDRELGAYITGTANGLEPFYEFSGGAMLRRFDAIFFLDMPTQAECRGIAKIWSEKKNVDIPQKFNFEGWTGADIKKLACTMSMLKTDAENAKRFVIPTATVLGPRLADMRKKAANVCIPASLSENATSSVRRVKIK